MAEARAADNGGGDDGESHDLRSLLSAEGRDFLVRSNGDQVNVSSLDGNIVGLYFSASWCGPCHRFTPRLIDIYNELSEKGSKFEVVFVSADENEDSFNSYFSTMPWLSIPFSDSETRDSISDLFDVSGIPHLVILDGAGKVLASEGVELVKDYGSRAYPFTHRKIDQLKEEEEVARKNQTLHSVLASPSRDFLISNSGGRVPIAQLEGKVVCLYFSVTSFGLCQEFTPHLARVYKILKEKGESFEVVLISMDDDELSFEQGFNTMLWLAVPFKDNIGERLASYFELEAIPTLVVIGPDGKTLHANAADLVEEHGVEAYPFTPEKLEELEQQEKARMEAQTLESLLVSGEQDYVIGKGGIKVTVSELVGKTILIYFSAQWCPPCRAFLPKLIEAYNKIKEKDGAFEVIFVSSDQDQSSFDDFFQEMPWLALPFGDHRKKSLSKTFKIYGIPSLVAIGPSGKTMTTEARELIADHGANAYPFTEVRVQELESKMQEMAKGWPKKVKHQLHEEHELELSRRRVYVCDACNRDGSWWSFCCGACNFDLHPKCALEEVKDEIHGAGEEGMNTEKVEVEVGKERYVCDGESCCRV